MTAYMFNRSALLLPAALLILFPAATETGVVPTDLSSHRSRLSLPPQLPASQQGGQLVGGVAVVGPEACGVGERGQERDGLAELRFNEAHPVWLARSESIS